MKVYELQENLEDYSTFYEVIENLEDSFFQKYAYGKK